MKKKIFIGIIGLALAVSAVVAAVYLHNDDNSLHSSDVYGEIEINSDEFTAPFATVDGSSGVLRVEGYETLPEIDYPDYS